MRKDKIEPVELPKKLLTGMDNKRDKRGIVVTWIVASHDNGEPWLGMVDAEKVKQALDNKLCQSCGISLGNTKVFIGPCLNGVFFEPGLHLECAIYSLKVCPHLRKELSSNKLDIKTCNDYNLIVEEIDGSIKKMAVPADNVISYECSNAINFLEELI